MDDVRMTGSAFVQTLILIPGFADPRTLRSTIELRNLAWSVEQKVKHRKKRVTVTPGLRRVGVDEDSPTPSGGQWITHVVLGQWRWPDQSPSALPRLIVCKRFPPDRIFRFFFHGEFFLSRKQPILPEATFQLLRHPCH